METRGAARVFKGAAPSAVLSESAEQRVHGNTAKTDNLQITVKFY